MDRRNCLQKKSLAITQGIFFLPILGMKNNDISIQFCAAFFPENLLAVKME